MLAAHISSVIHLSITDVTEELAGLKDGDQGSKFRHKKKTMNAGKGTYKTKEEIEKAPTEDHPCNLTRTTVRISFPAMKGELFVNLLGYKEPNLVPLWRCKGVCGSSDSSVGCFATRVQQKTVNMAVRTHLYGRDHRERMKELVLDEHMECGCRCNNVLPTQCADTFNSALCECQCEESVYGKEKANCALSPSSYWSDQFCQCFTQNIARQKTLQNDRFCYGNSFNMYNPGIANLFDILTYVFLGSCITIAVALTATTIYYRRRLKILRGSQQFADDKKKESASWHHPINPCNAVNSQLMDFQVSASRSFESSLSNQHNVDEAIPIVTSSDILHLVDDEPYKEKYDQHGVRIEDQVVIDF